MAKGTMPNSAEIVDLAAYRAAREELTMQVENYFVRQGAGQGRYVCGLQLASGQRVIVHTDVPLAEAKRFLNKQAACG